jgi:hypothetical protein
VEGDGGPALQHVLGTLDPRVRGMGPWQAVQLSNETVPVVDLTAARYTDEEGTVPATLTTEQRDELLALLGKIKKDEKPELTDEELDKLLADLDEEDGDGETGGEGEGATKTPELVGAALSKPAAGAIELAAGAEDRTRIAALEGEIALSKWAAERAELTSAGVPPAMLDLAAPLLSKAAGVIDLSAGSVTDPREIVRKVLAEAKGYVDLSAERGHGVAGTDEDKDTEQRDALLKTWNETYPQ